MNNRCAVIIPVFGAFSLAEGCLRSVLDYSPKNSRVIVIDDCSPQGEFLKALPSSLSSDSRLTFVRNESNLGFVATSNLGFELAQDDDAVLLNSDTVVTPGWLEKLSAAAYSKAKVATVTPFTNNGTICSLPNFGENNPIPPGFSLNEFANFIESLSKRDYPKLPTAVGFCMYIRREALKVLGYFDLDAFGLGYGEENDFCCRAVAQGFINILDDATYIFHHGNMSFGDIRAKLSEKNTRTLLSRYPDYEQNVAEFSKSFPLSETYTRILDELLYRWLNRPVPRILHVLHSGPFKARARALGGTEIHAREIINSTPEFTHWSIAPYADGIFFTAHLPGHDREFYLSKADVHLGEVVNRHYFDLIHVQHTLNLEIGELIAALEVHGNYFVSLHDFKLICPRNNLLTPALKVCTTKECQSDCGYDPAMISLQRQASTRLLSGAKKVITFSESAKNYFEKALTTRLPWETVPHGVPPREDKYTPSTDRTEEGEIRILLLGHLLEHKGFRLVRELTSTLIEARGKKLSWHLLGTIPAKAENLVEHGPYKREELSEKISQIAPHLVVILSICPETYSLTLSEAWREGLPVMVTPIGALAERVGKHGGGWILEDISVSAVRNVLDQIAADWPGYLKVRDEAGRLPLDLISKEIETYKSWYKTTKTSHSPDSAQVILKFLNRR